MPRKTGIFCYYLGSSPAQVAAAQSVAWQTLLTAPSEAHQGVKVSQFVVTQNTLADYPALKKSGFN